MGTGGDRRVGDADARRRRAALGIPLCILCIVTALSGCSAAALGWSMGLRAPGSEAASGGAASSEASEGAVYVNEAYGFRFSLPASWAHYRIVIDTWQGLAIGSETVVASGPVILIRHPDWTEAEPRQDIPIMVFTTAQWQALQDEKFHIGAAPIGPSELGANDSYVFALPARYNYAFPKGYEEVEAILAGEPLVPFPPGSR